MLQFCQLVSFPVPCSSTLPFPARGPTVYSFLSQAVHIAIAKVSDPSSNCPTATNLPRAIHRWQDQYCLLQPIPQLDSGKRKMAKTKLQYNNLVVLT